MTSRGVFIRSAGLIFLLGMALQSTECQADIVTLGDAEVDFANDGTTHDFFIGENETPIFSMFHFLSIDGSAPIGTGESPFTATDFEVNGHQGFVELTYNDGVDDLLQLRIDVELVNPVDGDNFAAIDYDVRFENVSSKSLDLRYYPYYDVDMNPAEFSSDTAFREGNRITQRNVNSNPNWQAEFESQDDISHWEIDIVGSEDDMLDRLLDAESPIDLKDSTNHLVQDLQFAFQFDRTLGVGESHVNEMTFRIGATAVPEVSSFHGLLMLTIGFAIYCGVRRSRFMRRSTN